MVQLFKNRTEKASEKSNVRHLGIRVIAVNYQVEIGDNLLVEAGVPPDVDIVLRLSLFNFLVVVSLHLYQRTENVLKKIIMFRDHSLILQ